MQLRVDQKNRLAGRVKDHDGAPREKQRRGLRAQVRRCEESATDSSLAKEGQEAEAWRREPRERPLSWVEVVCGLELSTLTLSTPLLLLVVSTNPSLSASVLRVPSITAQARLILTSTYRRTKPLSCLLHIITASTRTPRAKRIRYQESTLLSGRSQPKHS